MTNETLYSIALTRLPYISLTILHELYRNTGSAIALMEHRADIRELLPDASARLVEAFRNMDEPLRRAEAEMKWAESNRIDAIALSDERYPQRLKDCPDAPVVLYYRGNADLNKARVISVIGTRHCTPYGQDVIARFLKDLSHMCPDVLVMSGLAYGVDINAHREALRNGLPTIGVVAHGLDQIYPRSHRDTAVQMLQNGGLLTEYMSGTAMAKGNFVQRNRIVAGMADATILIESAERGGGLITMGIARDYNRDTFAFPGPVNAEYSRGCNNIIRDHGASLITSAEDFMRAMGWMDDHELQRARTEGIERNMFPDLTEDEKKIVDALTERNDQQINVLTVKTGIPINKLMTLLFSLEMKGVTRTQAGGCYHLI